MDGWSKKKKRENLAYIHTSVVKAVTQRKPFTTHLFLLVFQWQFSSDVEVCLCTTIHYIKAFL